MIRKQTTPTKISVLILIGILLFVAGCSNQTPVPIYITPTPATTTPVAIAQAVETDTVIPLSPTQEDPVTPTEENLNVPTVSSNQLPTLAVTSTPIQETLPSATPMPNIEPTNTIPPTFENIEGGEYISAVIGNGVILPPTSTPRPTLVPTNTPTFVPPTQAPDAITTAVPIDTVGLNRAEMGVQLYYNFGISDWNRTLDRVDDIRVDWIKLQAAWNWLQPDNPQQFDQNFRLFQLHIQEAHKRGYKVMLSIAKAPNWTRNVNRSDDGPPDDYNQFYDFLRFLLDKVGPYTDAIEVWNEPNLMREWSGAQDFNGAAYMEMFRGAYDVIRAYSSDITIITAGLAPTGNTANISVDDRDYLQQMYNAGLAQYQDIVIGIHPYSWGNPPDFTCCNNVENQGWDDRPQFFFQNTLADYRSILAANGHNVPMWSTEFGWATWQDYPTQPPDVWMTYNDPTDQMNYTMRAFEIAQESEDIELMILWNLNFANDTIIDKRSELAGYSLLYPYFDGSDGERRRPLFSALANRP